MRFVYHPHYDLNLGSHVFPSQKFRLIRDRILADGIAREEDIVQPAPARDEDLLLVHTESWIRKLHTGSISYTDLVRLEIPYSEAMVRAFWLAAGGSILAARLALEEGVAYNIGGGFHHAFANHGEGFCAINDIAVALRVLQKEQRVARAMIVDCDVHHGNGSAAIFAGDRSVFTLSAQQWNNYPSEKPPSDIDLHLPDGIGDDEYLAHLQPALDKALREHQPELVVFVAGADPYEDDQLGGLSLTMAGLIRRDELVLSSARERGAAVAIVLAGGYARNVQDTVQIHVNTAAVARRFAL